MTIRGSSIYRGDSGFRDRGYREDGGMVIV